MESHSTNSGKVVRLSRHRWWVRDPEGGRFWISYGERDGLWRVEGDEGLETQLDSDLREALADATESDIEDPWIVALADELERDLTRSKEDAA
jgi:hypothetical protein